MQNSSTTAETTPVEDSPWVVWQHPVSAIALLTVIFSIVILAAAFVFNACLPVYSFDLETLKFYTTYPAEEERSAAKIQCDAAPTALEPTRPDKNLTIAEIL